MSTSDENLNDDEDVTPPLITDEQDEESQYNVSELGQDDHLNEQGDDDGPGDDSGSAGYTWTRKTDVPFEEDEDFNNDNDEEDLEADDPEADEYLEGMDFGREIPIFANDENKALHARIVAKEKRIEVLDVEIQDTSSRVDIMTEHSKNVRQELKNTQSLLEVKRKEFESESHLNELAKRNIGRLHQDLAKLEVKARDAQELIATTQNFILKGQDKMESFKTEMSWNQDELDQWSVAAKQKDEDNAALEKYQRADEVKIKELSLEIEKLTKSVQDAQRQVANEVTETQAKQIELDRVAEEFRTLHRDRQNLIKQWEDTIETMQRRDADIGQAGETYAALKKELGEFKRVLNEQAHRLRAQEQDNVEVQSKMAAKEREQASARLELQKVGQSLSEFRDEVEVMKNELSSAANQLGQHRTKHQHAQVELCDRQAELALATERSAVVSKKLAQLQNHTQTSESLAKDASAELAAKEQELKLVIKSISTLKERIFKQSQELFTTRQEEANLIAEISGAQAASRNLKTKLRQLDAEALRQQELVYNGEFQIQQMERRVARASGERTADETKVLKDNIEVLTRELEAVKTQHTMLDTQCKKVEDEHRRQVRHQDSCLKTQLEMAGKIDAIELENESTQLSLSRACKRKEELLVQQDVLMLEKKRLERSLVDRADEVLHLENHKAQLQMSMEERKKEISVHQDVQKAQLKHAEEERHQISIEFTERRMKVDKLQAKYETLCKLTGGGFGAENEEDDGEERSQAYFVIKAAQRREELQRQGDELDENIRLAERELRGLQKTLRHLTSRNSHFRKSLQRVDPKGEAGQSVAKVEAKMEQMRDLVFKRKKEFQRVSADVADDSLKLDSVREQREELGRTVSHLGRAKDQVIKEMHTQLEKLARTKARTERHVKKHRVETTTNKGGSQGPTLEEVSFKTYFTKEVMNNVLYTLGQLSGEFPEISDALSSALSQHQLHLPTRPLSRELTSGNNNNNLASVRPLSAQSNRSDDSVTSIKSVTSSVASVVTRPTMSVNQVELGL